MKRSHPLLVAVEKSPSQVALARHLGISKQTLWSMVQEVKSGDYYVPAAHVRKLAAIAGCRPADLRPDLYDPRWTVRRYRIDAEGNPL